MRKRELMKDVRHQLFYNREENNNYLDKMVCNSKYTVSRIKSEDSILCSSEYIQALSACLDVQES